MPERLSKIGFRRVYGVIAAILPSPLYMLVKLTKVGVEIPGRG